ncbi:SLC13 family permease [Methylomarinum vadi]|uniref:SLC13 family permease n=1 Tax=Methylomarinum vadi TaxID=438855 RepID=UPI0004DED487|nr:SLC13 family permease [Methylomarinum vadi]
MIWQGWLSLGAVVGVLLTLIFTRVAPHLVMMAALTVLSVCGVLTSQEALAGFSNSGLITVAAMFVIAAGMHASGAVDLLVNSLLGQPRGVRAALTRIFAPVVLLSAFLNNTPVVATMIPALHAWTRKIGISPSQVMIPLSYCAILGGTLTLIGTSTNLMVNGLYQTLTGATGFSLFSISAVSLPVAMMGLSFMWLFFPKWLPNRDQDKALANLREFTLEVSVAPHGPLVGKTVEEAGLRNLKRVYLIEIERDDTVITAVPSEEKLHGGDRLVFAGDTEAISLLLRINGIVPSVDNNAHLQSLTAQRPERCLVEAVVSPHCEAVGNAIRDARFRDRYGAAVLAVARNGERIKGNLGSIILQAGDTLLLEARPAFVSRQRYNKDFLLINDLNTETPRHERAYLAWAILISVVSAVGVGYISMLNAALIGAGLMIIMGCCSVNQAERSLDLAVILTIAASFSLGAALQKTGVANFLADSIIDLSGGKGWLLLILTYLTVSLLTEVITNNAAAILMLPVVLEITEKSGLNSEPFVFAIMIAASASFATPLGYQTNLMVYGPGGYRFTDFLKVGVPMNLFVGATTIMVLLIGWPLDRTV